MDDEKQNEQENMPTDLEICEKLRDDYLAGWQRAKADFLNYKKEEAERISSILISIKADIIMKLLDIFDNLKKAQEECELAWQTNETKKIFATIEGVIQITKQLNVFMEGEGIKTIYGVGEQFNPNLHEAIEAVDSEQPPDTIIEIFQRGYTINGKLLRPAKVKISK